MESHNNLAPQSMRRMSELKYRCNCAGAQLQRIALITSGRPDAAGELRVRELR